MGKTDSLETLTNSIKCLIVFENKTSSLYEDIAGKTTRLPLIKSMLAQISLDSQKHSTVLKGLVQSLPKTDWKSDELPKPIGDAWRSIDTFQIELSAVQEMPDEEVSNLAEQLSGLESIMYDAYNTMVQYENLDVLLIQLNKIYNVSLKVLQSLFMELIHDEVHHKEILVAIQEFLGEREAKKLEIGPKVRFQNPDAWSRPTLPYVNG